MTLSVNGSQESVSQKIDGARGQYQEPSVVVKCLTLSLLEQKVSNSPNYTSIIVTLNNRRWLYQDAGQVIGVERHIYRSGDSESIELTERKSVYEIYMTFSWIPG